MSDFFQKIKTPIYKFLPWFLILIGTILRLAQYYDNRSLWMDEVRIALNVIERSYLELLQPLSYNQYAPLGFLLTEKFFVSALGNNEYILRLFPFICGICSLFLFYKLVTITLTRNSGLISLALFSILPSLVYYSTEAKQYSSDILFALMLFLLAIKFDESGFNFKNIVIFWIVGSLAIWFSHPAVFVLTGVGLTLFISYLTKKENGKITRLLIAYIPWIVCFIILYFVSLRTMVSANDLRDFWRNYFLPSLAESGKIALAFFDFLNLSYVTVIFLLIGCYFLFKEKRKIFFILASPFFIMLFASSLHLYPLWQRLLLFIVPSLLIFIGEGVQKIISKTWYYTPLIGIIVLVLLFTGPVYFVNQNLTNPRTFDEIKPALSYVRQYLKDGDIIYVNSILRHAYSYYANRYNLITKSPAKLNFTTPIEERTFNNLKYTVILGVSARYNNEKEDLEKFQGNKRVWIILPNSNRAEDPKFILEYLDQTGIRIASFIRPGIEVYLYDLS
ncbi:MAG: glycosyltransferase family 39 protein [Candidatus Melainabacteria bacterium]|nr:glycosyltransferase family 39 protein [Candidatus Melainabacteria bacterium]